MEIQQNVNDPDARDSNQPAWESKMDNILF